MSLSLSAYRIRSSSTAGFQEIISQTVAGGPKGASVTGTLSSTNREFIIKASSSGLISTPPKILFVLSSSPVAEFNTQGVPAFTVTGGIGVQSFGGYSIGDYLGIDNIINDVDTLPRYSVSGGIIIDNNSISIASITGGLSAGSSKWLRTGTTLTPLNSGDNMLLDGGNFTLQIVGGSATGIKYDSSFNRFDIFALGGDLKARFDPDGSDAFGVTGNAYFKGDINVDGSKNFRITHPNPDKQNMFLYHGALEGPERGVYFRKQFSISGESETIIFPDYWQYLVNEESVQVICDAPEYLNKKLSLTSIILERKNNVHYIKIPVSLLIIANRKNENDFEVERIF